MTYVPTPNPDAPCVLILGAQGFIGKRLRQRLASEYALLCVDVHPLIGLEAMISSEADACEEYLFRYDLGDPEQIEELFAEIGPQRQSRIVAVIHLAAYYDFLNKEDARYERLQTSMPALLAAVEQYVPDDAPLIYASSMAAMAPTEPGHKLTPESPRLGAWAYPQHKIASEKLLEGSSINNPIVELVLSGVYSDLCELVPLFQQVERVRQNSIEAYFYPGDVQRGLTYVHVDDCVDAFARAIPSMNARQGVHRLLIGEDQPMTYKAIHDAACETFFGHTKPLLPMPRFLAKFGASVLNTIGRIAGRRRFIQSWMVTFAGEHFEFDISKTTEELGWVPKHRIHERLGRILAVAHHHPSLWLETNQARPW